MAGGWLEAARREVHLSEDWQEFSRELFDVVLQQLAENHVEFFTDLSASEKALLVERAAKTIDRGNAHRVLMNRINSSLEQQIGNHLTSKTLQIQNEPVFSHVQDGVVTLLHKWPDMKSKLHVLFNHVLPPDLRTFTWRLYLSNTKARLEYLSSLSQSLPQSSNNMEIFLKCESLLASQPTFKTLRDSKYTNYLLLVPLVQVSIATTPRNTTLSLLSTLLVEEYLTLMEWWERYSKVQANQVSSSSAHEDCLEEVANLLDEKDKGVSDIIKNIYAQQAGNKLREDLLRGLRSILHPVINTLFVGHLTMETVLYIWDQYIIGLGQPSYNCIPAFCMAFIHLLREHLQICKTPGEVEVMLRSQAPALTTQQFQKVIKQHFYTNLYKRLNKQDTEVVSLLDPTEVGFAQPWTHLFRKQLSYQIHPKERRQAREEREAQHMRYMEKVKQEERLIRLREDCVRRREEEQLQRLVQETKRIHLEQKFSFEEKLQQERHLRFEMQRKAEEQVSQLQVEMRQMMQQRQHFLDVYSLRSITAPPPSLESGSSSGIPLPEQAISPEESMRTPGILRPNTRKAERVTLDLLQNLMDTANSRSPPPECHSRPGWRPQDPSCSESMCGRTNRTRWSRGFISSMRTLNTPTWHTPTADRTRSPCGTWRPPELPTPPQHQSPPPSRRHTPQPLPSRVDRSSSRARPGVVKQEQTSQRSQR
ncbi:uncharacterized protein [Scyliorhinus torazame]|uniref:uncharacterized protein isoform X3 n=1 Tax=Scyliorhinus torazame TaxID=75743 RepID=UPI003B5B82A9